MRLEAARTAIDARFDPAHALAGTVRYLTTARARFGRDDLAAASYHMGIGNLETVLRDYARAPAGEPIGAVVHTDLLSYARIFFDSSPIDHPAAWRRLTAFGDDSKTYYWRLLAAEQIMRLYRHDPTQLEALAYLHERKASAEEVLHPLPTTRRFLTPDVIEHARRQGLLQALPDQPSLTHFRVRPESRRTRPTTRPEARPLPGPAPRGASPTLLPRRESPHHQRQQHTADRDQRRPRRRLPTAPHPGPTPKRPTPTPSTQPATHSTSSENTAHPPKPKPSSTNSTGSRRST